MHALLLALFIATTPAPIVPINNPLSFPIQPSAKRQRAMVQLQARTDALGFATLDTLPKATAAVPRTRAWSQLSALSRGWPAAAAATQHLWLTRDLWGGFGHPGALRIVDDGVAVRICGLGRSLPVCVSFTAISAHEVIDVEWLRRTLEEQRTRVPTQPAHLRRISEWKGTAPNVSRPPTSTIALERNCRRNEVVLTVIVTDDRAGAMRWRYDAFSGAALGPADDAVNDIQLDDDATFLESWRRASHCPSAPP